MIQMSTVNCADSPIPDASESSNVSSEPLDVFDQILVDWIDVSEESDLLEFDGADLLEFDELDGYDLLNQDGIESNSDESGNGDEEIRIESNN